MYVVAVTVKTTDAPRAAEYIVEVYVNSEWREKERVRVFADSPQARRNFLLESNERLIVQELQYEVAVWDDEQKAAKMVPVTRQVVAAGEETKYSSQEEGEV